MKKEEGLHIKGYAWPVLQYVWPVSQYVTDKEFVTSKEFSIPTIQEMMDMEFGIVLRNGKINCQVLYKCLMGLMRKENANSYAECNEKEAVKYLQNNKTVFLLMMEEEHEGLWYITLDSSYIVDGKLCIDEIKQKELEKEPHVQKEFKLIVVEKK
jgi:hypothetical protein